MPMPPGSPPMDSPINGVDFNVLRLDVQAPTANPVVSVPTVLATVSPYSVASVDQNRTITMSAQSMMSMDGPFYLNGQLYDMERIDYTIPIDNIEIWSVTNQTMVAHPFHVHDVQFYLLDRDGNPVPAIERGRKDVVMIESMETIRFITKFDTYSDTVMPYVYHCHILMHEDAGMMGQFLVVPDGFLENSNDIKAEVPFVISPNPTSRALQISTKKNEMIHDLKIHNSAGQLVKSQNQLTQTEISVEDLVVGIYHISFFIGEKEYSSRFIKK
jgi:bilirubin oxidase